MWEIRTPTLEGAIRVLFSIDRDDAVLLHALKKKKRRLDPKDLALAERRFKDYVARK